MNLSSKTGEGMEQWLDYLRDLVKKMKAAKKS
jgi:hypothetical protein